MARQKVMEMSDAGEGMMPATVQTANMIDVGSWNIFNSKKNMFKQQVIRWMSEMMAPKQVPFVEDDQPS